MFNKTKNPHSAVLAVTYNCNSRCKMCNIWKTQNTNEVSPEVFKKLPKSLDDINITGGEPFLRNDLPEVLDTIFDRCNPSKLVISSNGFLTEKIVSVFKEFMKRDYINKIDIAFSIDGINHLHDEIRGIPGGYNMIMRTISSLKEMGFDRIGLGFTIMKGNEKEYLKVYKLSKVMGINFGVTIAHNAENYFGTDQNEDANAELIEEQVNEVIDEKVKSWKKAELGKSYYMKGIIHYAKTKKSLLPCDALTGSFFMDSQANIYPCNIRTESAGNLRENSFKKIWHGKKADEIRQNVVKKCPTPCWMVCTAKPAIKKHWFRTGMWILKKKLF